MADVVELTIPSDFKYLHAAGELIKRLASLHAFQPGDVEDIWLACHEVLVNAIRHGNREDPRKRVSMRIELEPDKACLEIRDQGKGFDPQTVEAPTSSRAIARTNGRGLFLVRHFMDRVDIDTEPGKPTVVRMTKRRLVA